MGIKTQTDGSSTSQFKDPAQFAKKVLACSLDLNQFIPMNPND